MRKEIVTLTSEFWDVPIYKIVDELAFDNQNILSSTSSIRFFQFIAAIESNFDVKVKDVHKIRTFGNLMNSIEKK